MDAHLAVLSHLPGLDVLHLDGARVADAGMEYVCRLPRLEVLLPSETAIADMRLLHLTELLKLRRTEAPLCGAVGNCVPGKNSAHAQAAIIP